MIKCANDNNDTGVTSIAFLISSSFVSPACAHSSKLFAKTLLLCNEMKTVRIVYLAIVRCCPETKRPR